MNNPTPQHLSATATALSIRWSDGMEGEISWRILRDKCPCAVCRVERATPPPMLPVLDLAQTLPIRATAMHPIGNYAYQIEFNDGHRTGIYSLDLLRNWSCPPKTGG